MKMENQTHSKHRVMLVDDHPVVRYGLAMLINDEQDLAVCGDFSSTSEALEKMASCRPDIAVVDVSLQGSNGMELTKAIREFHPGLPVLILSMHDETLYAERALRAGARGYVMKQEAADTVLKAIRTVLDGEIYLSPRISPNLLRTLSGASAEEPDRGGIDRLSDRELEVFELIGRGHSTRRIAESLHLSVKTIETHRAHIKQKLKLGDATELVHHAFLWIESGAAK